MLFRSAYDGICAQGKRDPRDQMNWVLEQMECGDYAQNRRFYIDGFPDFTRQHGNILQHLIRNSPCVTVSLTCDSLHTYEPAFETAARTARELVRFARSEGIEVQLLAVRPTQDPRLHKLCAGLFRGMQEQQPQLRQVLQAWHCDTAYEECQIAAEQVLELVRGGCRYRDIAVVCADPEGYRDQLGMVFRRCGIPVYLSGKIGRASCRERVSLCV